MSTNNRQDAERYDLDAELAELLALAERQGTSAESLAAGQGATSLVTEVRILVSEISTEPTDANA